MAYRDARLWEIAENLHRADLTELERRELQAEWAAMIAADIEGEKSLMRQLDAPTDIRKDGRKKGPQHQPSGTREEARRMNVPEPTLRRAKATAAIAPEAKDAIRTAGLDNNLSALPAAMAA